MRKEMIWPDGMDSAAMVTIELDNEFIWHDMDDSYRSPKNTSMGTYGTTRGLKRILDSLRTHQIRATFYIPGIAVEYYPEQILKIKEEGHEIALHGYAHEKFKSLELEEQRSRVRRGKQALEALIGTKVRGFRLPEGECTWGTRQMLKDEGFVYDNSFFDHDLPYFSEEGLVEIPMRWELQDFNYLALGPTFPIGKSRIAIYDDVLDNWLWELKADHEMGFCYVIKFDPQTIGSPGRMFMFDRVLDELQKRNIWIATGSEVADYYLSQK